MARRAAPWGARFLFVTCGLAFACDATFFRDAPPASPEAMTPPPGRVLPVCWATPGAWEQKLALRAALANSWERYANIRFTGFIDCPLTPSASPALEISLEVATAPPLGASWTTRGRGAAGFTGASLQLRVGPGTSSSRLELLAVQSVGGVLGLGPRRADVGRLQAEDIHTAQAAYGPSTWFQGMRHRLLPLVQVDADGRPDAVYLRDDQGLLDIGVNDHLQQDGEPSLQTTNVEAAALAWLTGDVDGDGRTDLLQLTGAPESLSLRVWTPTAEGFQPRAPHALRGNPRAFLYLPVDVNGDGATDLAELSPAPTGLLQIAVHVATPGQHHQSRPAVSMVGGIDALDWKTGDVDGDGRTDLLQVWSDEGEVRLVVHKPDAAGTGYVHGGVDTAHLHGPSEGSRFFAIDLDRDGRTDLVQARDAGGRVELRVHKNEGGVRFTTTWETLTREPWDSVEWLTGDTDLDGTPELLQLRGDGGRLRVTRWRWNGDGFVNADVSPTATVPATALAFHAADLSGDGRADLVQLRDDGRGSAIVGVLVYDAAMNAFSAAIITPRLGPL
ncbi:VCBS repeat-containing protein [Myxococcus stipitatus]|uniref:FG-GAP repeat domain-containing protein n=1 Tax=Myxococcus stipitatus TaxID=83455 RepID=UPI001F44283D|nr:VCBS repeat-containing protein [Myxococcus stipitatus]MCE9666358.1 VCBS repeat-containing protein [Myxococcus stipitatus]